MFNVYVAKWRTSVSTRFRSTILISMIVAASVVTFPAALLAEEPVQWYYLSSFGTDEVMRFEENTGRLLGALKTAVPGPFASSIGPDGDFFVAANTTAEILRFDGVTGEFEGAFVEAGSGGLSRPTAPIHTPDGKYLIVGDLDLNGYRRYDGATGEYLGVFADVSTSPINGPFMPIFSPHSNYEGKIFFASGFTNSIQVYDIETGEYEGDFVEPGSGGLSVPVGLSFGPDGNLYTTSSGTSSVKRYNGKTGEYMDDFVPAGSGGLDNPRGMEFGGRNSDLYVVSSDTNNVLQYDRTTGELLGVSSSGDESGYSLPRGLMFTARPDFFVEASPSVVCKKRGFAPIKVHFKVNDWIDRRPTIELLSITVNDPNRDPRKDVRGVRFGTKDDRFRINAENSGDLDRIYTIAYRATNVRGASTIATTTVTVPAIAHNCYCPKKR